MLTILLADSEGAGIEVADDDATKDALLKSVDDELDYTFVRSVAKLEALDV